jgi:hypothetical protein
VDARQHLSRPGLRTALPLLAIGSSVLPLAVLFTGELNHIPPPPNSASPIAASFPLEISPNPIDLGVLGDGQVARATVCVTNRGSRLLAVDRVDTSCPCLKVPPGAFQVGPGESKALAIEFDASQESGFAGTLSIEVTGHAAGSVVFRTAAKVQCEAQPRTRPQMGGDLPIGRHNR